MIDLVGSSCNPLASYLPRVGVRVANMPRIAHLRYQCERIFIGLRLLDKLGIGEVDARGSCESDHLSHVGNRIFPHLRYHIRK